MEQISTDIIISLFGSRSEGLWSGNKPNYSGASCWVPKGSDGRGGSRTAVDESSMGATTAWSEQGGNEGNGPARTIMLFLGHQGHAVTECFEGRRQNEAVRDYTVKGTLIEDRREIVCSLNTQRGDLPSRTTPMFAPFL